MTLVAAFRQKETPILIGDFLITAGATARGSRKKICRIADNFAIGWTGNLLAATRVISALRGRFRGGRPTAADVERFLTTYPTTDLGDLRVHIIGWILAETDVCFCWNSSWPTQLFEEPYHYDGSGGPRFMQRAGEDGQRPQIGHADPVVAAVCSVGLLMLDEITWRSNQQAGFGYGYEILFARDSAFHYVDGITWAFAQACFSQQGKYMRTDVVPRVCTNRTFGELSVYQIDELNPGHDTLHSDVVTPPFDFDRAEVDGLLRRLQGQNAPVVGDHLCLMMNMVRDADTPNPRPITPLIFTKWPGDSGEPFVDLTFTPSGAQGLNGTYHFKLPDGPFLEQIFARVMAARLKGNADPKQSA
ncbi:MAG: hypothetical protein HOP16_13875 [Acidobacteria bacterium]|nr:hypothetical protein [Acidobacteriota bacterium]